MKQPLEISKNIQTGGKASAKALRLESAGRVEGGKGATKCERRGWNVHKMWMLWMKPRVKGDEVGQVAKGQAL